MKSIDMTRGPILRQLVSFSLPLVFGNLFQLMYNMVDTIVIGRFAGSNALAAVGTCDPVMTLLINAISGLCVGASVLMSRFFGARDMQRLKDEMRTVLWMGLAAALVVLAVGLGCSRMILTALSVPEEILPLSLIYLRVIFVGMPFTCLYNIYAAALRAVGDSRTPLRYLIISSVTNMALDLIFVGLFRLDVFGAGLATVIAEAVSVLLCIRYVTRNVPSLHVSWRGLAPDMSLAGDTLRYGGLTALQSCAQPLGNLMIQSTINGLSVAAIAAYNSVRKIEDIGLLPGRSIGTAMMTFTAQNEGAKAHVRTHDGYRRGMVLEALASAAVCLFIWFMRRPLMLLFTADEAIIAEGLRYYAVCSFMYWLPCLNNGRQGYFRGTRRMGISLGGTLTQITLRVISSFILVPRLGIVGVGISCVVGWAAMMAWQAPLRMILEKKCTPQQTA